MAVIFSTVTHTHKKKKHPGYDSQTSRDPWTPEFENTEDSMYMGLLIEVSNVFIQLTMWCSVRALWCSMPSCLMWVAVLCVVGWFLSSRMLFLSCSIYTSLWTCRCPEEIMFERFKLWCIKTNYMFMFYLIMFTKAAFLVNPMLQFTGASLISKAACINFSFN